MFTDEWLIQTEKMRYSSKPRVHLGEIFELLSDFLAHLWLFKKCAMVGQSDQTSNTSDELFEALSEWEEQLKHVEIPEFSEGPEVGP